MKKKPMNLTSMGILWKCSAGQTFARKTIEEGILNNRWETDSMTSKVPLLLRLFDPGLPQSWAPQLARALPEVGNVQDPVGVPLLLLG